MPFLSPKKGTKDALNAQSRMQSKLTAAETHLELNRTSSST